MSCAGGEETCDEEAAETRRPRESASTEEAESALRVLIIDDEPQIGVTLKILLRDHEVLVLSSGLEAQRAVAERPFDVILFDLTLRGLDGIEFEAWLRTEHPHLVPKLVLMTGGAYTEEARSFVRGLPAQRHLSKPFTSKQIESLLLSFKTSASVPR